MFDKTKLNKTICYNFRYNLETIQVLFLFPIMSLEKEWIYLFPSQIGVNDREEEALSTTYDQEEEQLWLQTSCAPLKN